MIKELVAGIPTAEVNRRHGLSLTAFFNLKAKYGAVEIFEAALRQLN
jgi:putative transposase